MAGIPLADLSHTFLGYAQVFTALKLAVCSVERMVLLP